MVEATTLRVIDTVNFWTWIVIVMGFLVVPLHDPKYYWFRYIHAFCHPLIAFCYFCQARNPIWLSVLLGFVWLVLTLSWLMWAYRMHAGNDAVQILDGDQRIKGAAKFVREGMKLSKYKYQRI